MKLVDTIVDVMIGSCSPIVHHGFFRQRGFAIPNTLTPQKGEDTQMSLISKRSLLWLGMCFLASVVSVSAQGLVEYSLTTTPNLVAATGDAEVLGSSVLTAITVSVAGGYNQTMSFAFPGISCDNNSTTGMTLTEGGPSGNLNSSVVYFVAPPNDVVNTTSNTCIVYVVVAPTATIQVGDWLKLDGVRARMEFWTGGITAQVQVQASISSSSAASSIVPSIGAVATAYPNLMATVTSGTYLTCGTLWNVIKDDDPDDTPTAIAARAHITIAEPAAPNPVYQADFVDYTLPDVDTGGVTNPRPLYGASNGLANNGTGISIWVNNVPPGVTLTFPTHRHGNILKSAHVWYDHLYIDPSSSTTVVGSALPNSTLVEYDYTCGNQAICDTAPPESFDIVPGVAVTGLSVMGTITIQVQMNPRSTPTPGGVASFTTPPNANGLMPRWSDGLIPSPAATFIYISPCTTTLFYTWTANTGGMDTGLVINNTTQDYTNAPGLPASALIAPTGNPAYPTVTPTPAENGTCTLYFFDQAEAPVMWYTTPNLSTGATWSAMMSGLPFAGHSGYIIARCNFQYAHGFATLAAPTGAGAALVFGPAYTAAVIPDPVIISLTLPTFGLGSRLDSNVSVVPNVGESLNQ